MNALKTFVLIALFLPAISLHAQFSKGAKLIEPGFYVSHSNKTHNDVRGLTKDKRTEYNTTLGAGFFVADKFEWMIGISYGHSNLDTYDSLTLLPGPVTIRESYFRNKEFKFQTGIRQYFHLHKGLYGGYFAGPYVTRRFVSDSTRSVNINNNQFRTNNWKETDLGLQANLFVNYQISPRFGIRYSFGELNSDVSFINMDDFSSRIFEFDTRLFFSGISCYWLFNAKKLEAGDEL